MRIYVTNNCRNFKYKEEAEKYEEEIKGGGMLLAVPTLDQRTDEVRDIFTKHKASEVRQLELPSGVEDHR